MSEPIRVVMLIQGYYPRVGGAERQLASVAPLLQRHGLEVQVLTRRFPALGPFEIVDGVPVHRLPAPGPKALKSLTFTLGAVAMLRRLRPHLIHAHDLFSPSTTALLAKKLLDVPVVVKVVRGGHLGDIQRLRSRSFGRQRLGWLRERVDRFVVISEEIDRELAAIGVPAERRVFIPNGVDTTRFAPPSASEKSSRRRALGLPEAPTVVFTGRLAPEKRLRDLVGVWPAVRARCPGASLVLVGSGQEEEALAREAREGVCLAGAVPDVAPYLQAADLFVLPSTAEGLSNSLLEGMATGLACVATAVGGATELIEHGVSGWLVPPGEPGHLLDAMVTLLGDPDRRALIGQKARERVESSYSLPAMAARFPDLYRRVLGIERSPSGILET